MAEKRVKRVRRKPGDKDWLPQEEFDAQKKVKGKNLRGKGRKPPVSKKEKVPQAEAGKKRFVRPAQVFENANAQTVINIPVTFDPLAFQLMWLSVWSRMFEKSWNAMPPAYGDGYILDAFIIMQNVTAQVMGGATPEIRQLPVFVQTVLNLIAPKNVRFRINHLKYSWSSVFVTLDGPVIGVFPANVNLSWVFGSPDPGTELSYLALITPFALVGTDPANLQRAFGLIENLNADTRLVDTGTIKSGQNDPSAFARTYAYLGLGNSTAGEAYGECEMETSFVKSWIPAQFCTFGSLDTRASRSFRNKSGDSCLLTGLALMPSLRANDYRSGGPVIYKFLDFEEIYFWYVTWLTAAWSATLSVQDISAPPTLLTTNLPFTVQTFRIILRQALLQCFSNQAIVQFMSPKPQNGNADNVFVPFLLNAGTYSQTIFGTMKFPLILAENMKMNKTVVLKIPGSKAKVVHIPVLGKWINDTYLLDPQLNDNVVLAGYSGDTPQSIFMSSVGETEINMYDGSGAGPGIFYNMNALYYQTAVDQLNSVLGMLGNTGGNLDTVVGDAGPGLSLLNFTRYVVTANVGMQEKKQRRFAVLMDQQEKVMALKKSPSQKNLKDKLKETSKPESQVVHMRKKVGEITQNPAGSVFIDMTLSISSNQQLTQPIQALLKNFIIPTIRPDPSDSIQPQAFTEWQIANIEPNLAIYQTGGDAVASSYRSDDIIEVSLGVITNILNGANSSSLMATFQELVKDSEGPVWGDILKAGLSFAGAAANVFL